KSRPGNPLRVARSLFPGPVKRVRSTKRWQRNAVSVISEILPVAGPPERKARPFPRWEFAMPVSSLRPELARRIVWEAEAVHAKYPGRFQLTRGVDGLLAWEGTVPVEGRDFPVVVTYPAAYPGVPPLLETTAAVPRGCPHVLGRRGNRASLCWIAPA